MMLMMIMQCENDDHSFSSKASSSSQLSLKLSLKARLFAEMGFEGLFFARIDYKDKVQVLIKMLMMKDEQMILFMSMTMQIPG